MGLLTKSWTIGALVAGAVIAGQFPEFAQQYRQRLGGAVDELKAVVDDFDADAARSGFGRQEAIAALKESSESLPRDRGNSMERTIIRFERLNSQQAALEAAQPLMRPVHVLRYPDGGVLEGAWSDFEPAVPVTPAGGIWAAIGGLITAFFARLPISFYRRRKRRGDDMIGVKAGAGGRDVRVEGGPTGSPSLLEQLARDEARNGEGDGVSNPQVSDAQPGAPVRGGAGAALDAADQGSPSRMPLLEQIALRERLVGEIDERGRFVTPVGKDGTRKDQD